MKTLTFHISDKTCSEYQIEISDQQAENIKKMDRKELGEYLLNLKEKATCNGTDKFGYPELESYEVED
ncbi:hypothetical protein [Endozoicomonas lisbonensis]|uniref:Uncharacterized protein n=1 Tax=Endozoicomonas lisbonensis TaxID=3120522 RepID=A0ABV2SCX4_9GAMM